MMMMHRCCRRFPLRQVSQRLASSWWASAQHTHVGATAVLMSRRCCHTPPSPLEDFVDIDSLAGFSVADHTAARHDAPHLGVVRAPEVDEHTTYSRLNIPIAPTDADAPRKRAGSRAVSRDSSVHDAPAAGPSATDANSTAMMMMQEDPATATLPYDDEGFAQTLLQMEVEGAIDEVWQDQRTAHMEDVKEITEVLKAMKVRDICCINVSDKTASFDYMMFGTCEGPRHIHLASWAAQEADSAKRISKVPRQKSDEQWEVVPIGRIVLNLMVESLRDELSLERKWAVTANMDPLGAANAAVSEGRQVKAHGLWTLTLNLQDLEDFEVDYCKDVLLGQV